MVQRIKCVLHRFFFTFKRPDCLCSFKNCLCYELKSSYAYNQGIFSGRRRTSVIARALTTKCTNRTTEPTFRAVEVRELARPSRADLLRRYRQTELCSPEPIQHPSLRRRIIYKKTKSFIHASLDWASTALLMGMFHLYSIYQQCCSVKGT